MKILYEVVNLTDSDSDNMGVEDKKVLDVNNICRHFTQHNIQDYPGLLECDSLSIVISLITYTVL